MNFTYTGCCGVIPAYNEEKGLEGVLRSILTLVPNYLNQTIVVDDGSTDRTVEVASKYMSKGVIVLRHERNKGKKHALLTGIEYAIKIGYNPLITLDADGQHLPGDIPELLKKYREGNHLVVGERNLEEMPPKNRLANIVDAAFVSFITGKRLTDSQCGFRVIDKILFTDGKINLSGEGFTIESQMIIEAILNGYKVDSAKIKTVYFPERKSKIRVLKLGVDYAKMYYHYLPHILNGRKK